MTNSAPRGWNSFDSYGGFIDEVAARANLERFAQRLRPHGYDYFVLDIGWYCEYDLLPGSLVPARSAPSGFRVDEYGRYLPSRTYFPSGLAALAAQAHELGVRFGVHVMRGIPRVAVERRLPVLGTPYTAADVADPSSGCRWCDYNVGVDMSRPGAQEYYDSWVALLASWGVDFIKADDITRFPAEIDALATAIQRSGRPMVLSLSPGNDTDHRYAGAYRRADLVRTTSDIWDTRDDLDRAFRAWYAWPCGDGFWPDLDMLCLGRLRVRVPADAADIDDDLMAARHGKGRDRDCRLTPSQQRTFVTLRAMAAAPLILGGDLVLTDDATFDLVTDPELLACQGNGVVGRLRYAADGIEVWATPRRDDPGSGWVGVFNRTTEALLRTVPLGALGLGRTPDEELLVRLEPDDVRFTRYRTTGDSNGLT
ncbi:glycoside hydrolase family 27 protein [Jiangella mangrovi]|uniref:Alpha-galactosidase n=1 Tax=Jiangella mangrovi TaxID=1524084 RepID=A0A7W9GVU9_9ACTN|nr:glycoside hydrolase family 27 protein [Jiangella mangrovi]MBB5791013.1 hypothetical protein [Jiangella mangrovi]